MPYQPKDIEKKWQDAWEREGVYHAMDQSPDKKANKFFGLIEFPYPSGEGLHVGHPRSYVAIDIMTRKRRMEGRDVLYPIGWDAFGLPTENYAIKHKIKPQDATAKNIANFKRQIQSLGIGFDWSREINTTDPAYYKWTQWMFLQFFKNGMAYKATSTINWCPKCKIGLANEEAQGGVCERCGTAVEKREKAQWMIRITKYAERLLNDLSTVDYLDRIKAQQVNWIGKSEGAEVTFALSDAAPSVTVFTTRPDTLYGVTFLVISPELAQKWMDAGWQATDEVRSYVSNAMMKGDQERMEEAGREKTGVAAGVMATNPASNEQVPVWVADYVLGGYGTGAIMAVPAHDERDFAFAKKFGLEVKQVVFPGRAGEAESVRICLETLKKVRSLFEAGGVQIYLEGGLAMAFQNGIAYRAANDLDCDVRDEDQLRRAIEILKHDGWTIEETPNKVNATKTGEAKVELIFQKIGASEGPVFTVADFDDTIRELWGVQAKTLSVDFQRASKKWQSTQREKMTDTIDIEWIGKNCFEGEGISVNSGDFDRLSTADAKEKMIAWLEEKKIGKRMTTYKLRDWVFSRQRYWGEPIPLVHCDACAGKKQKVLIVHGFESSAEMNWFPWMKSKLESAGFEVFVPTMSTSHNPDYDTWMNELAPFINQLGEDDIVIGHSLGARAAIHAIAKAKRKIGHLFLVTPALFPSNYPWEKAAKEWEGSDVESFKKFIDVPLPLEEAGQFVTDRRVIFSTDDPFIVPDLAKTFFAGWFVQHWNAMGHMEGSEYPELADAILSAKSTGWIPLPDPELPLCLPDVDAYEPSDSGESPLANIDWWVKTTCPRCGGPATRETDTMPNWAGSSWYFMRYCDPKNDAAFADPEKLKFWMPVDLYNGGMEHTTLHLLYSRFWYKFFWDLGFVPRDCPSEPYAARRSHAMILGEGGVKMSKSKGNVVNPDDVVAAYGADVFRVYQMFIGPFDADAPWDTNGIEGVKRFLDKAWRVFDRDAGAIEVALPEDVETLFHQTVKKVGEDIEQMRFNTAVSAMMILVNRLGEVVGESSRLSKDVTEVCLKILAPFAPHMTEELWHALGQRETIHRAPWPTFDASKLQSSTFELVIQVDGKVRDRLTVPSDIAEEDARSRSLASEKVQSFISGKEIAKTVYVKGRILNIITK